MSHVTVIHATDNKYTLRKTIHFLYNKQRNIKLNISKNMQMYQNFVIDVSMVNID